MTVIHFSVDIDEQKVIIGRISCLIIEISKKNSLWISHTVELNEPNFFLNYEAKSCNRYLLMYKFSQSSWKYSCIDCLSQNLLGMYFLCLFAVRKKIMHCNPAIHLGFFCSSSVRTFVINNRLYHSKCSYGKTSSRSVHFNFYQFLPIPTNSYQFFPIPIPIPTNYQFQFQFQF